MATSPLLDVTPDVAPRAGMRGGLQRAAAVAQRAQVAASAAAGAVAAPLARHWDGAWKVAAVMVAILVVRVAEAFPAVRPFRPAIVTSVLATLLTIAFTPQSTWRALGRDRVFRQVLGYIGVAAAMIPFAIWKGGSYEIVQTMVLFDIPLVAAILLCAPRASTLERLFATFVASTTVYALAVRALGQSVEGDRMTSIGSYDPNDLAALFGIALPMACALLVRRRAGWLRGLGLVCAPILCYSITLTGSRGGMLALVAGTLVLVFGYNPARLVPVALAVALASPVVWIKAPETFRTRALSILALEDDYNTQSNSGRKYIWKRGLAFFVRSPIVGVGPGNFNTRLGQDFQARGEAGRWHTAHNTPIQILVEMGAGGAILYVLLIGGAVRAAVRVYRPRKLATGRDAPHYPEFLASLAAYGTAAMFLSHAFVHFTFMFFALGGYARHVFDRELGPARPFGPFR